MTALGWVGIWCLVAAPIAVVIGRGIRLGDRALADIGTDDDLCALIQPENWSDDAIRAEFDAMVPGFATEAWFE